MLKRHQPIVAAVLGILIFMGVLGWMVHYGHENALKADWERDAVLKVQRLDRAISEAQAKIEIYGESLASQMDEVTPEAFVGLKTRLEEKILLKLELKELLLRQLKTEEKVFLLGEDKPSDPSLWRASIYDAKRQKQTVSALELSEYGLRVLTVVPLKNSDWALELTVDLQTLLENYSRREGTEVAVLIPANRWMGKGDETVVDAGGHAWALSMATNPSVLSAVKNPAMRRFLGGRAFGMSVEKDSAFGMVLLDGVEYQSQNAPTVGDKISFMLWSDYSGQAEEKIAASRGIILSLWLTAAVFGGCVGYFGLSYRQKAKQRLAEAFDKIKALSSAAQNEAAARQRVEERLRGIADTMYVSRVESDAVVATLSHQLKVTAAGVVGYSKLIRNAVSDEERIEASVELSSAGQRVLRMAENLEVWARKADCEKTFAPAEVDLAEVVEGQLHAFVSWIDRKKIVLQKTLEPLLKVRADRRLLEVMVKNLLANAVKYTEAGGAITLSTRVTVEGVELSVVDKGVGISHERMARIFDVGSLDRLSRGVEGEEGAGLGLPLCQWVASLHRAAFRVNSDTGRGCRVVVIFPTDPRVA